MASINLIVLGLASALLALVSWQRTARPPIRASLAIIASISLGFALTGSLWTLALLVFDVILVAVTWRLARWRQFTTAWGIIWIAGLVSLLIIAKVQQGQGAVTFVAGPAAWVGVSYFLFRLIHVCLDARHGQLGDATLSETIVYALHPATLIAGPIDRLQHSILEQRRLPDSPRYALNGLWRLFVGLFKKLVLANLLYLFSNTTGAYAKGSSSPAIAWAWLLCYAFYIYFDFAAYSDIAIGASLLTGLHLPENFANPYLQPNIMSFWGAWHITLSTWLRDYVFFPISRGLLRRFGSSFAPVILLVSHLTTMLLCGLWHGLTFGFAAWGLWHGLGLFAHSQLPALRRRFGLPSIPMALSTGITFLFVALGWVFFNTSLLFGLRMLGRLLGVV